MIVRTMTVIAFTMTIPVYQIPRNRQHNRRKYKQPWFYPVRYKFRVCKFWCEQPDNRQRYGQYTAKQVW